MKSIPELFVHGLKFFYTVVCASSGEEVLKLVQYRPRVIILDVYKPLPSIKVCKRLRQLKTYYKHGCIPIILFSTNLSQKYQSIIKQLGGIDWIAKPARMNDLLEQIQTRIPRKGIEMTFWDQRLTIFWIYKVNLESILIQ